MKRRSVPRYAADRFIPVVFAFLDGGPPLGGHLVDICGDGARIISPPNLAPLPKGDTMAELVFARSDSNRDVDVDGVRQPVKLNTVRTNPGARIFHLSFYGPINRRVNAYLRMLSRQDTSLHRHDLPEFDPDVWAGWAAIAPGEPAR